MRRWLLALALIVSGCAVSEDGEPGADSGATTSRPAPPSDTTVPASGPTTSTSVPDTAPSDIVLTAIDDLADRLEVDTRRIRLIESTRVTWPDGSLGCPRPGESYTQALVEGYRVVLSHEGRAFDYHASEDASPFLCPTDEPDGGYEIIPPPGFDT